MKSYETVALQITKLLRARPRGMTITDISRYLHLNRNSVAKYLEVLVTAGQVERQRIGRAKLFFLSQRVPISAMLNLSSDMILIFDEESRIWYVNENLLAFEGKKREDLIGKRLDEAGIGVLGDPEVLARIQAPPEEQEYQKEVVLPRETGTSYFTVSLISTIFEDGSKGITVIVEDITERKRAEESLKEHLAFVQELLDRIPTPVFYKNLEGHYLGCNRAFEEFTRRPRGQILDRRAGDVLPAGLANRFESMDEDALKTGITQTFESSISYNDRTSRHFIVFKAPFRKQDGTWGGVVGTIFDITDWKSAEKAFAERESVFERRIRELTSSMAMDPQSD